MLPCPGRRSSSHLGPFGLAGHRITATTPLVHTAQRTTSHWTTSDPERRSKSTVACEAVTTEFHVPAVG